MPKTNYHLHLTGYVGGYDFDRSYVDYVLAQNKDKEVNVLIDSLGGSLATALSIASAFRNHGNVNVHFVGMNASAATIASLGARHISIDSSAMYLVHKCSASFFEWGSLNSDQLQNLKESIEQMQTDLDKMDANVAQMYAAKCGKKKKCATDMLELMKVGGWLTAREAAEWGFVDEITEWEEAAPVLTDKVACAMTEAGIPLPDIPQEGKEAGSLTRLLNALTSFFHAASTRTAQATARKEGMKEGDSPKATIMKKIFSLLGVILSVEAFAFDENKRVWLTEAQMQSIEDALRQKEEAIREKEEALAGLREQVEAYRKKPAEETTHVVNNGGEQHEVRNSAEEYVETLNSARSLFDLLP